MEQVFIVALLCVLSAWGQRIPDVKGVETTYRTETELTLEWEIVQDNRSYIYFLKRNEIESGPITVSENETKVTHRVSHLMPGMNHMFTLFTSLDDRRSEGFPFSSKTIPSRVEVTVEGQTETNIMLKWKKDQRDHTYELQRDKMEPELITNGDTQVEHTVDSLSPGTKYFFTLTTVFGDLKSSAYPFQGATVPPAIQINSTISRTETSITLEWIRQKEDYTFQLKYNSVVEEITKPETIVVYVVQGLSPGTGYTFRLVTVFEELNSVESNYRDYTVPSQVDSVSVLSANDTSVNLQWNAVPGLENNNYRYILEYNSIVSEELFAVNNVVKYHVPKLIPATNYDFTLYTKFYEERSSGLPFSHMTSLSNVTEVRVTRLVTELTVEWNKLNNDDIYNYTLLRSDGTEKNFTGSSHGDVISYRYQPLKPGTVHSFTLFTVSNNVRNFGYSFKSITTIDCKSFDWMVTNTSVEAEVKGSTYVTALNNIGRGKNDSIDNNVVRLQDLYPGESYTVSLFYDLDSEMLHQCSHRLTLVPNTVTRLYCKYHSGGNGLEVMWEFPYGIVDVVQVDVNQKPFNIYNNNSEEKGMQKVIGLQVAQWYKVSATSFSGVMKSEKITISCQTDPAGVIAGVLVCFLLVIIIIAGVFIWRRYGSHKKQSEEHSMSKVLTKNYRRIPSRDFQAHFENMSQDDNRGFSAEYEELGSVGVQQTTYAALLPDNKNKNRFSNVLPYDGSRVLLEKQNGQSDYINANYMPGFGTASKQYIAAQGPLPSTVNDFWRMVWEVKAPAIIMVTNCTEGGRVKCEQYWPLDYTPCLYGNLLVTVKSENRSQSWMLREFNVKNKATFETRTLKHFHFTAWPDHGVPRSTYELIQFRGLIRQNIESSFSTGPTVVHCSAGVGRTGTLIALDVLLQQLKRENAVGIAAFVQEMRLSRPLMVQTESQYVFLHQCILDSLQSMMSDAIYENVDTIYVNEAVAMGELQRGSQI